MIEVEIKVKVTEQQKQNLIQVANFISQEIIVDTYYDSKKYSLTIKGMWLRARNGLFELKTPATQTGGFNIDKNIPMHEFTNQDEIAKILNLHECYKISFLDALTKVGYKEIYKIITTRESYKKNKFIIDFDCARCDNLTYTACELETIVDNKDQCQNALNDLLAFIKPFGISSEKAEGKLWYFIKNINPTHYQALKNAGEK
jgi:predicted adenylyl cyclase CyaB